MSLGVGDPAPDFTATAHTGETVSHDLIDRVNLMYKFFQHAGLVVFGKLATTQQGKDQEVPAEHEGVSGRFDSVGTHRSGRSFEGRSGGRLCVFAKSDGEKLLEYDLPAPPVYDGMAVARGRLCLSLKNGAVVCFAGGAP